MSVEALLSIVPKFDGTGGAIEWLYKFEASIDLLSIPAEKILSHIILFLEGDAYLWYSSVLNFGLFNSLEVFRDLFLRWFSSPTERVMDKLSKCIFIEEEGFRGYIISQSKLFSSLNQLLDDVVKIQWFIRGLPQEWRLVFLSKDFKLYEDLSYYAISLDKGDTPECRTDARISSVEIRSSSINRSLSSETSTRQSRVSGIKKSRTSNSTDGSSKSSIEPSNSNNCTVRALSNANCKSTSMSSKACLDFGLSHEGVSIVNPDSFVKESTPYPLIFDVRVNGVQTLAGIHNLFKQSTISPALLEKVNSGGTRLKLFNQPGEAQGKSCTAEIVFSSSLVFECVVQVQEMQEVGLILGEDFLIENRAKIYHGPDRLTIHSTT